MPLLRGVLVVVAAAASVVIVRVVYRWEKERVASWKLTWGLVLYFMVIYGVVALAL